MSILSAFPPSPILLTGASGYIGGRLLLRLQQQERPLRCLARRPEFLRQRVGPRTEVLYGDLSDGAGLAEALHGVATAYYLVHSLSGGRDFQTADRRAVENFVAAARSAGLRRIIYLGGLGETGPRLSPHLRSRQEVGRRLRESGIPVIEFRASIVIGSGSLSFELIRSLVERLLLIPTPRWVRTPAQPIAIDDLLTYLVQALDLPAGRNMIFEIGGADIVSYGGIMAEYARQRGLRRWMIPLPILTPRLSSLGLGLVTPLYARIGRNLIEGLRNPTVVCAGGTANFFTVRPMTMRQAVELALCNEHHPAPLTRWFDPLSASGAPAHFAADRDGRLLLDRRRRFMPLPAAAVFSAIERLGGESGWYFANALWRLRGLLDLMLGGVGFRRGRYHPRYLAIGQPLDCFRVENLIRGEYLRLVAELRLPGRAWLEFVVRQTDAGSEVTQIASFLPSGVFGRLVWYALFPFHAWIFRGLLRGIARAAAGKQG